MASQIWGFTSPDSTPVSSGLDWWMHVETILVILFVVFAAFKQLYFGKMIINKFLLKNSRVRMLEENADNLQKEIESMIQGMEEAFRERDQAELERITYKELFEKTALATIPQISDVNSSGTLIGIYEDAQSREIAPVAISQEVSERLDKQHDKLVEKILRLAEIPKDPE